MLKQTSNDAGNRFADDGTMALTMAGSGSDHETEELALNRPPYTYDALSFRRKRFTTEKLSTGKLLRRVAHHYDAVGNNVETKDASTHAAYFGEATMAASADGAYTYDAVGNIAHMRHRASPHGSQTYDEGTNRLATTTHHDGTRTYSHDAHGNTADMPHLAGVDRDFADWRWPVEKQSGGQPAHDASGRRVRKVYEEYHPYGTSAYRSFGSADVSAKRYRYTGKERDEETGLYYHGARYYMCWLARWASADPLGVGADGPGLYTYVRGSPVVLSDPSGMEGLKLDPKLSTLQSGFSPPTITLGPTTLIRHPQPLAPHSPHGANSSIPSVDSLRPSASPEQSIDWWESSARYGESSGSARVPRLLQDRLTLQSESMVTDPPAPEPPAPTPNDLRAAAKALPRRSQEGGTSVDWEFIESLEGFVLKAYVPVPEAKGTHSGMTIGGGVDIGQMTEAQLDGMDLPPSLKDALRPYVNMTGKRAASFVKQNPLTITRDQAQLLTRAKRQEIVADVRRYYDAAAVAQDAAPGASGRSLRFDELPAAAQTVIASVAFNHGPALHRAAPKFWGHVTRQNWSAALRELRNFGNPTLQPRRNREARYLERGLRAP